jgi:hypothetical protein
MPPALGALGDDDIGAGFRSAHRLGDSRRHVRDFAAGALRTFEITLSGRAQANCITLGLNSSAISKLSSRVSNRRKFRPNGLFVPWRMAPVRSRICSGVW